MGERKTWSFEGYWAAVLGANRSPSDVVREFDLRTDGGCAGWLNRAQRDAWIAGGEGGPQPDEWDDFYTRAFGLLVSALKVAS